MTRSLFDAQTLIRLFAGPSGLISQIGWFTQMWTMDTYPELASYRGLQRQFNGSARFALTSSALNASGLGPPDACPDCGARVWNTTASGYGALFAIDPSWAGDVQLHVTLNNMNLMVEWSGSENGLIQAFTKLNAIHQPFIMAFYEPHSLFNLWIAKNDSSYRLSRISLPEYDSNLCNASCADFSSLVVQKIVNSQLSTTNPEVYWLTRLWTITNTDINNFLSYSDILGLEDRDSACMWVKQNNATWSRWLWFRQCPNNCNSPNGYCFMNQCVCVDQWSGVDCGIPENTYEVPIIAGGLAFSAILVVIYLSLRYNCPSGQNTIVFSIGLSIAKVIADSIFWIRYSGFTNRSVYILFTGVAFIGAPVLLSFLLMSTLLGREVKKNSSFRKYMDRYTLPLCAVMMLSSLNPAIIKLSSSRIMKWAVFTAPLSLELSKNVKYLSLLSTLVQDLPQIALQAYVSAQTRWVPIAIASISVSLLSLVFGLTNSIFDQLLLKYSGGHHTADQPNTKEVSEKTFGEHGKPPNFVKSEPV
ncbi:uncharacterized protein BJ171DRAFT_221151 [Polychytrium aggregatum]|uniref:uncharacterized protein n=1 Tax=Polychytrium aggregatum TaxID=110093 RepID=UPI0022FE4C61|nr:uncharacterized protein BJ171DRAFT_221151 [Polychytrium aggregatum]KAI9197465.1 hypothetical protein BJ171DRAFT_221151 [Polychytrium aggregatum]